MGEETGQRPAVVEPRSAMSVALLVNPDSGKGEAERARLELAELRAAVEVYPISEWEQAASSSADRIAVAGGDGSVGWAAAAASAARAPLAVIPAGTANDFARALRLPDDLHAACQLAVNGGRTRSLELGRMGDRPFVNATSVGLPPVAALKARGWKRPLGTLAYVIGAVRAGLSAKSVDCGLRCDGALVFSGRAWQVTIACTGAFGAGSQVDANPSDGALDVVVVEATPRLTLAFRAYGLRRGRLESQRGVRSFRARRVELEVPDGTPYNVDGELITGGALALLAVPGAFDVVVG